MRRRALRAIAPLAALAALLVPRPRSANALDLEGSLREVATANPTLESRRAMVEAARHRVPPAGAWPSPMLELGAINVPTSGRFDMDPMTMKMIGIEQRIPLFGSNRLSGKSARAALDVEGATLEVEHYELLAMAWEAYADAYYAEERERSSAAHQGAMDRLVRSARARYEAGTGRLDDVLRAEAERARTVSDFVAFRAEALAARARLAALMGREGSSLVDSLAPPPRATLPSDAAPMLAAISAPHPRLRGLKAQVERYRLAAQAARRMVWPDLQLGMSYGFREPIEGVPQDDMWSATVGFMLPIFARQREYAEGSEMDEMARASESDLRAATLNLDQQIRELHAAALAAHRMIALLSDTVVVTQRRAVEASWASYSAGSTDLWRVFEAAHALYGEEVALTRARQDLSRTEARLLAVLARGDLLGVPVPEIRRNEP